MKVYKNGVATYPGRFKECVVSENKICIQFWDTQAKVRVQRGQEAELTQRHQIPVCLPIEPQPVQLSFLAVGTVLPVLKETQLELIAAYKEHLETYQTKDMREFLTTMVTELNKVLDA